MKTVKQIKMELRNQIEDMKNAYRFSNIEIAEACGVTNVTVGHAINAPHRVSAEMMERIYNGCAELENVRIRKITERQTIEVQS